jgi:soluble lytic murein transglycosylase-like protein
MRIWVFAAALTAFTQPALATASHRHSHYGIRTHDIHYARHHPFAYAGRTPVESGYAMAQTFARTDAIDTPFFSAPSFPNRSWNESSDRPRALVRQPSTLMPAPRSAAHDHGALDAMIARHAAANGLPVELVHRVVVRESRYNPRARNGGNLGLMQIRYATARGVGYTGSAAGLFDAETNLTYAVRYLAGAYRAAGGNAGRAVAYYASGYHGRGVRQQPAAQQIASSQPLRGMQSPPVLTRDDAIYPPRARADYRQL